ncbi:MAG: glycosyltransferase, partial [Nitriliruptoraceae bacterium]
LLAAGALVVTTSTPALEAALTGLAEADRQLLLAPSAARDALEERSELLLADADRRRRLSVRVRRHVHAALSTRVAVTRVVAALGWDAPPPERISVLLATRRPGRLHQVLAELAAQRHADLEVVLLPHGEDPLPTDLPGMDRVAAVQRVGADRPLGAVLNAGLDLATGAYLAKIDDDDRYGPQHLSDLLLDLHHTGAEVVGRRVHGVYEEPADVTVHPPPGGEERYEDHLPGATMLLPAEVLRALRWRQVPSGVDTELVRAVHLAGGSVYTGHRYGFVRVRHDDHTSDAVARIGGRAVPGFDPSLLEA